MYSSAVLRWGVLGFTVLMLSPLLIATFAASPFDDPGDLLPVWFRLGLATVFAVGMGMVALKFAGQSIQPLWITLSACLYVSAWSLASLLPPPSYLWAFVIGWLLAKWWLELTLLVAVYVGMGIAAAQFFAALMTMVLR